jgi:hypothetical protein
METLDPRLIQAVATQLQDNEVGEARAAELAGEVGRLNAAVLRETGALRFRDEPGHFFSALEEAAR